MATVDQMGVDAKLFYAPQKGTQDKYYSMRGGYIQDFTFDPTGYKLSADFIERFDDLFKWPLYVSRQALQDSGYAGSKSILNRCGLVLGNLSFPTKSSHHLLAPIYKQALEAPTRELLQNQPFSLEQLAPAGSLSPYNLMTFGYPAAFVSQALALGGVNFALDAACASSLYAVKMAGQYLLTGKADLMLAGAVSRADPFFINMGFSIFQAYPENGASTPLNKASGGLVAGEGAGIFVLKRHSDALRDGDKIYAVISGIGLSNDGKGKFLLQPNPKGQILALERAYENAGIDPQSIDYVECHATGTPVGDKTEINSMDTFFGRHQAAPLVGSAKSNFGHLLTAAGMAGMTKVILSMAHQQIPATINLTDPLSSRNNVISAKQMVKTTISWPNQSESKRAAVSAFGFGGTNAHLILEETIKASNGTQSTIQPQPNRKPVQSVQRKASAVEVSKIQPFGKAQDKHPKSEMAIVGMDAFFGSCNGLDAFGRTVYDGNRHFIPVPPGRWQGIENQADVLKMYGFDNGQAPHGAYITDFDMDFLHYKIPPNNDQPIPQQLLILKVADRALKDAGLKEGGNVAVIIATGTELSLHRFRGRVDLSWQLKKSLDKSGIQLSAAQLAKLEQISKDSIHEAAQVNQYTSFIGNIMASRISSQWDFSGPSFTLSAEENSSFKALEVAQMFLVAGEVDAVVVGAVDLAGGVENVLLRNQLSRVNTGSHTLSFDQNVNGWMIGEGAGVVVLKRHEDAVQANDRVYAVIDAVSVVQGDSTDDTLPSTASPLPTAEGVVQACHQALAEINLTPANVGYLELFGSGIAQEDEAEITGLTTAYQMPSAELSCAIGSIKANIGHTYAASGIASLIKTAHCLYHRYIPATPDWSAPKMPAAWQDSPFYVAPQSKPWLLEPGTNKRVAAINGLGTDRSYAHLILSDVPGRPQADNTYLAQTPFYLFPVAANEQSTLLERLKQLQQTIEDGILLTAAAQQSFETYQKQPQATYALTIVGHNKDELIREIQSALSSVAHTFETGVDWKTPLGSYFTPNPLYQQGKVTFVYPGAFSAYPGLGRDFFHLFPQLHSGFADMVPNPSELVGEKSLYPRSLSHLSKQQLKYLTLKLMADSITMLQSGATFSTLATKILREHFKVKPQAALGYSLGETTMMFALGVWSVQDNKSADLRTSPLFKERLSGPQNAVREYWNLPAASGSNAENIWGLCVLKAPAAEVSRVVMHEDRVYLTHINTPQEVVIAGDPQACARVIQALKCDFVPVPYSHVIHCEVMRSEQNEFLRLNTLPIADTPELDFYFAAGNTSAPLSSETIGRNIATAVCQPIDFSGLIQRAYDDGARIFIELGPRSACTWWITDILKDKAHLAVGINRRSIDDRTALVKLLAQLTSHRVPLDLSSLYEPTQENKPQQRSLVRTVSLTDKGIRDSILTAENKRKFSHLPVKSGAALTQNGLRPGEPHLSATIQKSTKQQTLPNLKELDAGYPATQQPMNDNFSTPSPPLLALPEENEVDKQPPLPEVQANDTSDFFDRQLQKLSENADRANQGQATFLRTRQEALRQINTLIQQQLDMSHGLPEHPDLSLPQTAEILEAPAVLDHTLTRPDNYSQPDHVIWDEADLVEFAEGNIAPIFGEAYAIIDTYSRRVRLPMPPYLLVSRITKLKGQRNVYQPSSMTTEYDIPFEAWYSTDGQIPWAVAVESGQCDLLLISYLGIDFENKGQRVYRLLDCTLTFLEEVPLEGHTLRYDISIDSFAKSGESLLFFFSYNCFVGDTMVLKMRGGCAGFFSDAELAGGKGIIVTEKEQEKKRQIPKSHFAPLLKCSKTSFNRAELLQLSRGDIAAAFGNYYDQQGLNPSLRLPPEGILMVDRITTVDPSGGAWGLGLIISEKDLEPDHWYFPCHFKDDQVMAGSLVAEGCSQLLQFYLLYLGFQTKTQDARFQPVLNLPQVVRTRKQIMACSSKLIYRMEITEIGLAPQPYAKANVDIIFEDKVVVDFKNLGLQLTEKKPSDPHFVESLAASQTFEVSKTSKASTAPKPALFNEDHIQEFAMGSISNCFGPEYKIFEGRRVPRTPNGDLKLISRIVEIKAERFVFTDQPSLISEYDVPPDPWFYRQNAYPTTPYSILMEIALQPCGFLSAYLGSTLPYPDEDFYFRNLDGDGHLSKNIDIRGKTITNRVQLLSSTAIQGIIIQKFNFQLECDGDVFYKGTAVFGYFQPQALANQVGLDQGKKVKPWFQQEDVSIQPATPGPNTEQHPRALPATRIDLNAPVAKQQFYQSTAGNPLNAGKPYYHLAQAQLNLLDEALIIPGGGRHKQGYIYAAKKVDPQDWFFSCHFFQDPVMPGSLGIEAILQAMQLYALQQNLAANFQSPYFTHLPNHQTTWMYRGQILSYDSTMNLEVHISTVDIGHDQITLIGEASLWKGDLRIYEVKQIALSILDL